MKDLTQEELKAVQGGASSENLEVAAARQESEFRLNHGGGHGGGTNESEKTI